MVRLLLEAGATLTWPMGVQAVVDATSAGQPAVAEMLMELEPEVRDAQAWLTQPGMTDFADMVDGDRFLPDKVRQHAERRRQALSTSDKGRTRGRTAKARGGGRPGPTLSSAERQQLVDQICSQIAAPEFAEMLANGSDAGPLLRIASKFGLAAVVHALIDAGSSPNTRDIRQRNALHYVSSSRLGAAALEVAQRLVAAGTQIDARDKDGQTPLMLAAAASDVDMVALLLDAGADATSKASGMTVAMHAKGPSEGAVVELLSLCAPDRPAVVFASQEKAVPAGMGCKRWLDALPGDGRVWAILGGLDDVATAGVVALAVWRIDHLERQPAPRVSGGWILLQVKGSNWILLWPFGIEPSQYAGALVQAKELSGTLRRELLTVRASDSTGSVLVRRLRGGKVVESVTWEICGPCTEFRSELRNKSEWLSTPKSKGRKETSRPKLHPSSATSPSWLWKCQTTIFDHDGLDTQLVLPETAREGVVGVVCLAK